MKKTTVEIPAVEMSLEEENALWDTLMENKGILPGIRHWNTADGNNEIQFEGENFFRVIVRPKS